jgi:hypothetical protein
LLPGQVHHRTDKIDLEFEINLLEGWVFRDTIVDVLVAYAGNMSQKGCTVPFCSCLSVATRTSAPRTDTNLYWGISFSCLLRCSGCLLRRIELKGMYRSNLFLILCGIFSYLALFIGQV